jgi:hypothetical protein
MAGSLPFLIHFSTVSGFTEHNNAALPVVNDEVDMREAQLVRLSTLSTLSPF